MGKAFEDIFDGIPLCGLAACGPSCAAVLFEWSSFREMREMRGNNSRKLTRKWFSF